MTSTLENFSETKQSLKRSFAHTKPAEQAVLYDLISNSSHQFHVGGMRSFIHQPSCTFCPCRARLPTSSGLSKH